MERMIDLLIEGASDDPSHEPLGLYQAAKAVGYQRKAARELAISRVFTEAYYAKKKAFDNNQPQPILCPSLEVVRLQMEHHRQMNKLLQELRDTQQKLDDTRREMVEPYKHCPKNPKPPKSEDGVGYAIRLDPQEAKTDA